MKKESFTLEKKQIQITYSVFHKTVEKVHEKLQMFNVVIKQIVWATAWQPTYYDKWVHAQCTITVVHVHLNIIT